MCFTIHRDHQEPKIAKRDIVCYKAGFERSSYRAFEPYYRYHTYWLGQEQPRIDLKPLNGEIFEGYHSYSNKKHMYREWRPFYVKYVKCIIPKGTRYYYNPQEKVYVSETIIVQEYIEP